MEDIFGSGPKFPKVLHLEISTSSEGKELYLRLFFADGRSWSDPCWVKARGMKAEREVEKIKRLTKHVLMALLL